MTTYAVPPTGSPAWREIYPVPPLLRLETVGPWCPLDDSRLQTREDGWGCTACTAGWDFYGESARWLPSAAELAVPAVRWRPSALLVLAGLAGCAAAAAALVALLSTLDEHLVLLFAAVIAAAAVAVVLVPLAGRTRDWARYRHNTVRVLDADGEVRDEH